MKDFLNSGGKSYEVEIVWDIDVSDEDSMWGEYIHGGYCNCGNSVEDTFNFCPKCGHQIHFVPFKPIKTDLTLRQYNFLKQYTNLDKFQIASTTKVQAIKIIGDIMERWKLERDADYSDWDDWEYSMIDEPF
jgi:hypothetical protein